MSEISQSPSGRPDPIKSVTAEQVDGLMEIIIDGVERNVESGIIGLTPVMAIATREFDFSLPADEESGLPQLGDHIKMSIYLLADAELNGALDKKLLMKRMAAIVFKSRSIPVLAGAATEAWQSILAKDEKRTFIMPADDPKRREIVMASALDLHGNYARMAMREIKRDAKERMSFAVPGWARHEVPAGQGFDTMQLLARFFRAYMAFGMKQERPEDYMGMDLKQVHRVGSIGG